MDPSNNLLLLEVVNLVQLSLEHGGELALILVIPIVGRGTSLEEGGAVKERYILE